jgi:hypothetical protein
VDDDARKKKVQIACEIIYEKNYVVNSEAMENLLKEESLVPTSVRPISTESFQYMTDPSQNSFSTQLARFGFNLFSILVIDLMHEFELGIWKALFVHLIRILEANSMALVNEMDHQYATRYNFLQTCTKNTILSYRQVPTFGRDTI